MKLFLKESFNDQEIAIEIEKLARKENLFTDIFHTGAGYIANTRYVDLSSNKFRTHGAFDELIVEEGIYEYPEDIDMLDAAIPLPVKYCNWIRINDRIEFFKEFVIQLPLNKPSYKQFELLQKWLKDKTKTLTVSNAYGNIFQTYDMSQLDEEYVTTRIKNFYSSGTLHEKFN